jgi:hypothetical protein
MERTRNEESQAKTKKSYANELSTSEFGLIKGAVAVHPPLPSLTFHRSIDFANV